MTKSRCDNKTAYPQFLSIRSLKLFDILERPTGVDLHERAADIWVTDCVFRPPFLSDRSESFLYGKLSLTERAFFRSTSVPVNFWSHFCYQKLYLCARVCARACVCVNASVCVCACVCVY